MRDYFRTPPRKGEQINSNLERIQSHPNEFMFFDASFGAAFLNPVSKHIAKRIPDQLSDWTTYHQSTGIFASAHVDVIVAMTIGGMSRLARESIQRGFTITSDMERDFFNLCWRAIAK